MTFCGPRVTHQTDSHKDFPYCLGHIVNVIVLLGCRQAYCLTPRVCECCNDQDAGETNPTIISGPGNIPVRYSNCMTPKAKSKVDENTKYTVSLIRLDRKDILSVLT
jgi:hypothetical protein